MNKKISNIISLLTGFVVILAMSITLQLLKTNSIFIRLAIVLGSFFASFVIDSVIHEYGKLLVGKILGFKLLSTRTLNSIKLVDKDGKKVKKNFYDSMRYLHIIMNKKENRTKQSAIIYFLGGSIVNFICFILFLVIGLLQEDASIKTIFVIFAINNIYTILTSTIPLNSSYSNDGSYLYSIIKDEKSYELFFKEMDYLEHITHSSPTSFDVKSLHIDEVKFTNPIHIQAKLILIDNLIFNKKFTEALNEINVLIEKNDLICDEVQIDLLLKRIFLETMSNNNEAANAHRDDLPRETKKYSESKSITRAIESYAYHKFSSMDEYASELAYETATSLFDKAAYDGLVEEQRKFLDFLKNYRFIDKLN